MCSDLSLQSYHVSCTYVLFHCFCVLTASRLVAKNNETNLPSMSNMCNLQNRRIRFPRHVGSSFAMHVFILLTFNLKTTRTRGSTLDNLLHVGKRRRPECPGSIGAATGAGNASSCETEGHDNMLRESGKQHERLLSHPWPCGLCVLFSVAL